MLVPDIDSEFTIKYRSRLLRMSPAFPRSPTVMIWAASSHKTRPREEENRMARLSEGKILL